MIIKTTTNNEFHKNGQLAYTETICILASSFAGLYNRRLQHPSGYEWIRTGRQAKYFDNGQIAWELFYDNMEMLYETKPAIIEKMAAV